MSGLRPVQHLESVSRDYPGLWKQYASILTNRRKLGDWPSWCFCPVGAAFAIVSAGRGQLLAARALDIARIAALASWRATQGIYRFDSTLRDELLSTPLSGDLPAEHLQRLPEWCVYVELGSPGGVEGFFAHLEYDLSTHNAELMLLIDYADRLVPVALQLRGTLDESLAAFVSHAKSGVPAGTQLATMTELVQTVEPLVSVLLYLCASDAEMTPTRDPKRTHEPAMPRRKNGELYLPPAKRPEVWQTGFKLGAALRQAYGHGDTSSGAGPRGHIRRAHWHSYWKGSGEDRERELRWLPPIPVNLELPEQATVHRVKPQP